MIAIPKRLGQIWIGHRPPPHAWMDSWKALHPEWEYRVYGNEYLFSRRWRHQELINEYYRRGTYAGVSDLMRYQILQEEGGFLPEADSTCLRPTDELWVTPSLYAVWESEERKPGLISPFLASVPRHPYLEFVLERIGWKNRPETLQNAWKAVGNQFLKKALRNRMPEDFVVFPSHYFIPTHKRSERYSGSCPVYCEQHWGSTFHLYEEPEGVDVGALRAEHLRRLQDNLAPASRSEAG